MGRVLTAGIFHQRLKRCHSDSPAAATRQIFPQRRTILKPSAEPRINRLRLSDFLSLTDVDGFSAGAKSEHQALAY